MFNSHDNVKAIDTALVNEFFEPYSADAHKGDFGRVLIIAGSVGMTGAAFLAGLSAVRSGAGLVTVAVPESLNDILEAKLTEAMTLPLPEGSKRSFGENSLDPALEFASKCDAVVLGPGLSTAEETQYFVRHFVSSCDKTMVIDADALNVLSSTPDVLKSARAAKIITPHPGEMASLLSSTVQEVQFHRHKAARDAAEKFDCISVLKGAHTLVCSGEALWVNPTGNPGMATGGSGDVLSGMIGGFLARGLRPLEATLAGVFIHGLAGDMAASKVGEISLIAGDIIDFLPKAIIETVLSMS